MADIPLIRDYADDAILAYREGHAIRVEQFLGDVAQLAALLPARGNILNLCSDRYRFVVGLSAALVRGQISLLPPNHTPNLIEQLKQCYSDVYCLTDGLAEHPDLPTLCYPESAGSAQAAVPSIAADQVAALVFTSGSTGEPVPQRKIWGALVRSARAEAERLGLRARSGMAILGTVPAQHMYGLESTVMLATQNGLALHAGRPFYPADVLAGLEALPRPRGLVTTPVHLRALLAESVAPPPVDFLLCATAPLSPQLAADAEARFAAPLTEIYGCTEAGQVATRRTVGTAEWRTFPGIALRQDQHGTWARGGHVEADTLLADVIELRDATRFLLHGRTADLVNIAGKRTSLANLNYHLNSIAGVVDGVFVVPAGDDDSVTRLTAFVVAPGVTSDAITNALRQRIDAVFLPRPLCLVDALPRNTTGKLPREALNQLVCQVAAKAG